MAETLYRGRRAATIQNAGIRLTVLAEGGHVAEIFDKRSGVNPLWTPPWPSLEPSAYSRERHPGYGADAESKLLAGIMGHNLCLDIFGPPSAEEAAAGLTVHGEASVVPYEIESGAEELTMRATFPQCQLAFERRVQLAGDSVEFTEAVENLTATDRPIAWTEHVTLGPPFLEKGLTRCAVTATRSKVDEDDLGPGSYMPPGAEFDWPHVPCSAGGTADLRTYTAAPSSQAFTTHLMDPARQIASFVAWSPSSKVALGYAWHRSDFPWLGMWEENYCREQPPWNRSTLTRGMEFGASPMAEPRRRMIERGRLFGTPCFRWIPARARAEVRYRAALAAAGEAPERLEWDSRGVRFA